MSQGVADATCSKICNELEHIFADFLNVPMYFFINVICEHVKFTTIIRQVRRDFLADERVREMSDLQASLDGIVISDCDQRHPSFFSQYYKGEPDR